MNDLQYRVGIWGHATFGTPDKSIYVAHLRDELDELEHGGNIEEECADMALLLYHFAFRFGFDLNEAIERKFEIVQKRTYGKTDDRGVRHHE